ncbi:MAG: hypothetical protein V2A73_13620, partial [Pseudomonadota bacterium]
TEKTVLQASGSLGVGAFGSRPAMTVEVGADVSRGEIAVGLGGRLRLLAGSGLREEDWDEPSEGASLIRYATIRHRANTKAELSYSLALGPQAEAWLGHGSLVAGYTAGLDADHGRSGLSCRLASEKLQLEALADDLVGPRIMAARAAWNVAGRLWLGGTLALDRSAPDGTGASQAVPAAAIDAELSSGSSLGVVTNGWTGSLIADLVVVGHRGAGLHLGGRARHARKGSIVLEGRGELRLGTDEYLPGWFSPLYELSRAHFGLERAVPGETQLRVTGEGKLGGLGTRFEVKAGWQDLGEIAMAYEARAGTRDLLVAKLAFDGRRAAQIGFWLAAELADSGIDGGGGGSDEYSSYDGGPRLAGAAVFEGRIRLPGAVFLSLDIARLYQEDERHFLIPIWIASIATGLALGD